MNKLTAHQANEHMNNGGIVSNIEVGFILHKKDGAVLSELNCPFPKILEEYPDNWYVVPTHSEKWWKLITSSKREEYRNTYFQNLPKEQDLKPCEIEYIFDALKDKRRNQI